MAKVTMVPATKMRHTGAPIQGGVKRKVAGYARVSTDNDEQLTSYEAQVDYYTRYISSNPEWEFAGVYTDEGISGLTTKHREGFNRMIADALDGKIEMIVTKSVSRFARNTVDSLSTIRLLKDHGVEVFFEKENIRTFDGKGELLLTIMSSLAQEESRSISENITWGQRKRFADGKIIIPYGQFLGYRKGPDGNPEIDPEEAEIVRLIYKMFMDGKGPGDIARHLTQQEIPTPRNKTKWARGTVESILTNEKYKGDALLQKAFTVDYLKKKLKKNEGEVPYYIVTDSHPAIISRMGWDKVQAEFERRKKCNIAYITTKTFTSRVFCGECGSVYGSKVWHSNSKYRKVVWRCNAKYEHGTGCSTPHLYEDEIKALFLKAVSKLGESRKTLLDDCEFIRSILEDTTEYEKELSALTIERKEVEAITAALVMQNATEPMDINEYNRRYEGYVQRHDGILEKIRKLEGKQTSLQKELDILNGFIQDIRDMKDLPIEFSDRLWNALVDKMTVYADGKVSFLFKNGATVTLNI